MTCQCSCHSSLGDERIDTLASVDMELARTRRRLLERRNELLPINCLPPELLSYILETENRENSAQEWQQWLLGVTQVCRGWRTAARSCPTLWNTVDMDCPMLVKQNLHLAGSLPLNVHTHSGRGDSVKEALALLPRARILDVTFGEPDAAMISSLLPHKDAPSLQSLTLKYHGTELYETNKVVLPSALQAPKLAGLVLLFVPLDWDSLEMCHRIQVLRLGFMNPQPETRAFENMLKALTQLEVLSIKDCIPWDLDRATQQQSIHVDLSNLKVLEIVDDCEEMLRFMDHISLGPLTRVLLSDAIRQEDEHNLWPVMTNVINKCLQLMDKPVQALMTQWKDARYEFRGWAEELETPGDPPTLHVLMDLSKTQDPYHFRQGTMLLRLTSGIREFRLGHWKNILRNRPPEALPEMHSVATQDQLAIDVIKFLQDHADKADIWPNLTRSDLSDGGHSESDLRRLETALSQRTSRTGRQLKQLVLRLGNDFEAKEEVVGTVLYVRPTNESVQYQPFNEVILMYVQEAAYRE
jgi:hypothetical protein